MLGNREPSLARVATIDEPQNTTAFARVNFSRDRIDGPAIDVVIACIGSVTATAATEYGLNVDIQPEQFTAKDLAHAIAEFYRSQDLH